ncbi:class I adenylate-forming enzyme family protein [Bradyrhizobium elkanii]|uniref:class I adenylate-forming enzyme family protein n=1 Tax=Bradyrhizobium elkanii TaxID=29448 RepID=UPI0004ADE595|nr:AMP-binding protein [Bradyrhizobium elkanii]WLA83281.1 AMP-binding protein [Bradyrhizobium elkanii]
MSTPDLSHINRVGRLLDHAAERFPNFTAIIDGARSWTWKELGDAALAAASAIERLGVRPGDRLMIVGENSFEFVVLYLAAARGDVWPILTNARLTAREVAQIRHHGQPRRTIYVTASSDDASSHALAHGVENLNVPGLGGLKVSGLADCEPERCYDAPEKQVSVVLYTSGTTGAPKGVMLSHASLLAVTREVISTQFVRSDDRFYGILPFSHIYSLVWVLLSACATGASIILARRFDVAQALSLLESGGITRLQGVPTMFVKILEALDGQRIEAPSLRQISTGAAPLDLALKSAVEEAFQLPLANGYGMTEMAPTITVVKFGERRADAACGHPLPGVEVRLVAVDGKEIEHEGVGEILTRGPGLMLGYYKNAAATSDALSDGWLKTGDLGTRESDGAIRVVGRTKDVIIRSGFNVYPEEVEAVLMSHPAVALAGIVGRSRGSADEDAIAFVQLVPGTDCSETELQEFAAQRLTGYKRPSVVVKIEAMPLNTTGKVLKTKLRELAANLPS